MSMESNQFLKSDVRPWIEKVTEIETKRRKIIREIKNPFNSEFIG